ncbi:DUF4139 domain-containing protein [Anaerolineales bacterium]
MRSYRFVVFLLVLAFSIPTGLLAQENLEDGVAVTIYNSGSSLVQDRRTFDFQSGINTLNFTDVAAYIDPTSVTFKSLTDPDGTSVLEQNYVFDLVDRSALLNRYLDENITVTMQDGTTLSGQLLSGRNGEVILRADNSEIIALSLEDVRDLRFPDLPEGLITRPTLSWLLNAENGGSQQIELTYLTGGISWAADYNILLSAANDALDLNGWVTFTNTSGSSYKDALVKLVAGDVNRLPDDRMYAMDSAMGAAPYAEEAVKQVEQRDLFEYKLYEIGRPVTIASNESKQVEFVTGTDIPAKLYYVYDSSPYFYGYYNVIQDQYYGDTGYTDVQNWIEFTTDKEGGLGADLPAGRIRVYQQDIDGSALLIGENQIDHTPEGEVINLFLGNAFDLVGERRQVDFTIMDPYRIRETYEIKLRNRKDDKSVEVRIPENLFRWSNWEILDSSHEYEKVNSSNIEFRVEVPPQGETVITYTVEYTWR